MSDPTPPATERAEKAASVLLQFIDLPSIGRHQQSNIRNALSKLRTAEREAGREQAASEDTPRLDWLDQNMDCDRSGPGLHLSDLEIGDDQTLREAIDSALEATKDV